MRKKVSERVCERVCKRGEGNVDRNGDLKKSSEAAICKKFLK